MTPGPAMSWVAWALLAAFFAAVTAVLAKVGVAGVDASLATALRTTVVLVFTWLIAAATTPPGALGAIPRRAWVFLVLSGLATGASWLCYFRALQLGPASRVAPLDKLSVVFTLAFAGLFLHERLGWSQLAGAGLMVAGALLLTRG